MGQYHVDRTGKGIFLGRTSDIHFDEEFLAKYAPTRKEAKEFLNEEGYNVNLRDFEEWPLHKKFMVTPGNSWRFVSWYYRPDRDFSDEAPQIYSNAMSMIFEKMYGYPQDNFVSVSDYDSNTMIFCHASWPPAEYNEALATLTEDKLEKQLQEFLVLVTGDDKYRDAELEICEEYIKE